MDLYAYSKINDLGQIAKDNGIEIPRIRGYRLMKDEKPILAEEIKRIKKQSEINIVKDLCTSIPFWTPNSNSHEFSDRTYRHEMYYLVSTKDPDRPESIIFTDVRWDRIHGKKRNVLKLAIKQQHCRIQAQFDTWNKYAGREDVLYIHSRMGGNNWTNYGNKDYIINQPWFLDRVDDYFDSTYCDFYARIEKR